MSNIPENLYEVMFHKLSAQYVKVQEIARILSLAIKSEKNVLLWGPGGHGKSEIVQLALSLVANEDEIFVQSFGEGMDEATLWGGLDFAALERDKVLRYFPEQSFLAQPYAVFEEIFDAPASVLLALKDTLTAKKLRKGSQMYQMKTKVIICNTNKDPKELADLGPAAAALVERFPLQYKVEWPSYKASDYLELFNVVSPRLIGADLNGTKAVLAEVFAKATADGNFVSPRTAVHALGVVKAAAALRGSNYVEKQDLLDLCFLPGMEAFASNLKQELDNAFERAAAEGRLREAEAKFISLKQEMEDAVSKQSPLAVLKAVKKFRLFADEVAALKVTDAFTDRRKKLRESVEAKITEGQRAAESATRI